MLNRYKISFDNIYYYANKYNQLDNVEAGILNADKDVAESNLETIKKYSYIYCESDNTFASQVGREIGLSAKDFGMYGLNAAGIGIGCMSLLTDSPSNFMSASAASLAIGITGGAVIGGLIGGWHALEMRSRHMILNTPEEKKRVSELQKLAESRVMFFHSHANNIKPVSEEKPVLKYMKS